LPSKFFPLSVTNFRQITRITSASIHLTQ